MVRATEKVNVVSIKCYITAAYSQLLHGAIILQHTNDKDDRQTDRRQTDGRAIAYSEREREFTFANKYQQHPYLTNFDVFIKHNVTHLDVIMQRYLH